HGQTVEEHGADDDGDEGDDIGEDRPLDEEPGDHGPVFLGGRDGEAPGCGGPAPPSPPRGACPPRAALPRPLPITHSWPVRPSSIARSPPTAEPVVTPLRSTTFFSFTANT